MMINLQEKFLPDVAEEILIQNIWKNMADN